MGVTPVRSAKGASLVEALVAIAVFAAGVAGFAPLLVTSVRSGDASTARTRALALAQDKVAQLESTPYSDFPGAAFGSEVLDGGFTRQWKPLAAPELAGETGDFQRILVTVRWARPGTSSSVALLVSRGRY